MFAYKRESLGTRLIPQCVAHNDVINTALHIYMYIITHIHTCIYTVYVSLHYYNTLHLEVGVVVPCVLEVHCVCGSEAQWHGAKQNPQLTK